MNHSKSHIMPSWSPLCARKFSKHALVPRPPSLCILVPQVPSDNVTIVDCVTGELSGRVFLAGMDGQLDR